MNDMSGSMERMDSSEALDRGRAMQMARQMVQDSILLTSEQTDKIMPAFIKAWGKFDSPNKNKKVTVRTQAGSYEFKYATHDAIVEATRAGLTEEGLAVMQPPCMARDGKLFLVTRLVHESSQWIEAVLPLPPVTNNPQAFGSMLTYLKRYAYASLLSVVADEDDDGNAAAGNEVTASRQQEPRRQTQETRRPAPDQRRDPERDERSGPSDQGGQGSGSSEQESGPPPKLFLIMDTAETAKPNEVVPPANVPVGRHYYTLFNAILTRETNAEAIEMWVARNATNLSNLKKSFPKTYDACMAARDKRLEEIRNEV